MIKLKEIRKNKGYTLAQLGSLIGCTSSHLSQLERGIKQPSLDMLRRISACLEVPVFDLLPENEPADIPGTAKTADRKYDIILHQDRKKFVMPEILTEYEFITPYFSDGSDHTRIVGMYSLLAPGKWSCEQPVALDFDFSIYIVQGTANVFIEKNPLTLSKDDSMYLYAGTPHNIYNAGNNDLIIIGYSERNHTHKINP